MKVFAQSSSLDSAYPSWVSSAVKSPAVESRLSSHRILTPDILRAIQDSTGSQHPLTPEILSSLQSHGIVVPYNNTSKPPDRAEFPRWRFGEHIFRTTHSIQTNDHDKIPIDLQFMLSQLPQAAQITDSGGKKVISLRMLSVNLISVIAVLKELWENDLEHYIELSRTDITEEFLHFGSQLLHNKPADDIPDLNLAPGFTHDSSQAWAVLGIGSELMADFHILTGNSNSSYVQDLLEFSQRAYTWADIIAIEENVRDAREQSANKIRRIRQEMRSHLLIMTLRADAKSRLLQ